MYGLSVGYNYEVTNAFQSERDTRIKRARENRVVYNGFHDVDGAVAQLLANMTERAEDVFYKLDKTPIQPPADLAPELKKAYNYEIALVHTDFRKNMNALAYGNTGSLFNMDATLVSFFVLLNGFLGTSVASIMRNSRPMGILELTGRDTKAKGATIIAGGVTIGLNRWTAAFVTGDLLACVPVPPDEVHLLTAQGGEIANVSGRITPILQPVRFLSFYEPRDIRQALWTELVLGGGVGGSPVEFLRARDFAGKGAAAAAKLLNNNEERRKRVLTRTYADEAFAKSVVALVEFYAHSLQQAGLITDVASGDDPTARDDDNAFNKAVFLFLAATFYHPGTSTPDEKKIKEYCAKFAYQPKNSPADFLSDRIIKVLKNKNAADKLFKKNLIGGTVHAMHEHKLAQERSIVGLVVTGSMPGGHSQMHMCRSSF
jgi:hypothetical protein